MIELLSRSDELADISVLAKQFAKQPQDCFNHCDVRSDNLAFHPQTGELKLVDWNWVSYVPRGSGATEFLIDMARHGQDVTPWLDELNVEMLASFIGFFLFAVSNRRLSRVIIFVKCRHCQQLQLMIC